MYKDQNTGTQDNNIRMLNFANIFYDELNKNETSYQALWDVSGID